MATFSVFSVDITSSSTCCEFSWAFVYSKSEAKWKFLMKVTIFPLPFSVLIVWSVQCFCLEPDYWLLSIKYNLNSDDYQINRLGSDVICMKCIILSSDTCQRNPYRIIRYLMVLFWQCFLQVYFCLNMDYHAFNPTIDLEHSNLMIFLIFFFIIHEKYINLMVAFESFSAADLNNVIFDYFFYIFRAVSQL